MPCYHPITAWKPRDGGQVLFDPNRTDSDEIQIPCGQCRGCRRKRARAWAIRCVHEARTHKYNSFITLTYNDEHLPKDKSLTHDHFRKFIHRLLSKTHRQVARWEKQQSEQRLPAYSSLKVKSRKTPTSLPSRPLAGSGGTGGRQFQPTILWDPNEYQWRIRPASTKPRFVLARRLPIRFYMCGEYGDENARPHYHALLFGIDFADKRVFTVRRGNAIYTSETLDQLWGMGFASIGEASYESARYISEYILKKVTGDKKNYYEQTDDNGEITRRVKEYNAMSRRPGVGSGYLRKYGDYLTHGWVIQGGHKATPPRYYDEFLKTNHPTEWEEIQHARYLLQLKQLEHHTPERLKVQEAVDRARTRSIKREL